MTHVGKSGEASGKEKRRRKEKADEGDIAEISKTTCATVERPAGTETGVRWTRPVRRREEKQEKEQQLTGTHRLATKHSSNVQKQECFRLSNRQFPLILTDPSLPFPLSFVPLFLSFSDALLVSVSFLPLLHSSFFLLFALCFSVSPCLCSCVALHFSSHVATSLSSRLFLPLFSVSALYLSQPTPLLFLQLGIRSFTRPARGEPGQLSHATVALDTRLFHPSVEDVHERNGTGKRVPLPSPP